MVAVRGDQRGVRIARARVTVANRQAIHVQRASEAHGCVDRFATIRNCTATARRRTITTIVVGVNHGDIRFIGDAHAQLGVELTRVSAQEGHAHTDNKTPHHARKLTRVDMSVET